MQWHRLPPRHLDECRFRGPVAPDPAGGSAECGLVRAALPLADGRWCRAAADACAACCRLDPPTPDVWNTVVASLVHRAAAAVAADPAAPPEAVAQAAAARDRAAPRLAMVGPVPASGPPPVPHAGPLSELIPPPAVRRRRRIATWAVGVTTAPRRAATLARCLDALTRAGWDAPHLFMDGGVRVPERFGHLPGTLRSPAVGAWPNHYLALFELTLRQPDADAYLVLQDDALIYDGENVRAYLERALWPGWRAPVVSLYCPEPYTAARFGWHRFRRAWVWGALAFVFSPEAARRYLRDRRVCQHRWRSAAGGLRQIDVLLGWWARRRLVPVWYPTPSLVQHVGEVSTLWLSCRAAGPRAASQVVARPGGDGPADVPPGADAPG